jgi:hypothetical protein
LTDATPVPPATAAPQPFHFTWPATTPPSPHARITVVGLTTGFPLQSGNAMVLEAAATGSEHGTVESEQQTAATASKCNLMRARSTNTSQNPEARIKKKRTPFGVLSS